MKLRLEQLHAVQSENALKTLAHWPESYFNSHTFAFKLPILSRLLPIRCEQGTLISCAPSLYSSATSAWNALRECCRCPCRHQVTGYLSSTLSTRSVLPPAIRSVAEGREVKAVMPDIEYRHHAFC